MEITVDTPSKSYPIFIGSYAMDKLAEVVTSHQFTQLLVITDETVGPLHMDTLQKGLPQNINTAVFTVPAGERAKRMDVYEDCLTFALEQGLDRKSCMIAFGGGAVGDLTGFVAATYMRGISFIQVPTTILAHDSAVGGKTAINHPLGKNMIGAFHQPEAVIYHTDFLRTLPEREVRSGFAEVMKHALIADPALLREMMDGIRDLNSLNDGLLAHTLQKGMEIKAEVVSVDEKENGLRAILNFGHTLGHVIETESGYGTITHGEAVAVGMVYAIRLSDRLLNLQFPIEDFCRWLNGLGYKLALPEQLSFSDAFTGMLRDKKTIDKNPRFVLLEEIGKPVITDVDKGVLEEIFNKMKECKS